jgi:diguanylate cyclase (GGDEF)-like protein
LTSRLRQRLGWTQRGDLAPLLTSDRTVMARALMYLLVGIGTAIVASVVIPDAPLEGSSEVTVLAGIAYAGALGVLIGFDKLPAWGFHALVLFSTGLISWSIHTSEDAGSPYKIFYVWIVIYAAFFFRARMTAFHVAAMLAGYGGVLVAMDNASDPALHWAITASALILIAGAIQALTGNLMHLVERLTEIGRADSLTGLYNAAAFKEAINNEIERARRSGNRLGVVIAEIDDLSPVVSAGLSADHQRLMEAVGQVFRTAPRQIDIAARLGGGRFAVLLPYTDEHGAYLMAERTRTLIAPLEAPGGGRVRISLGVAGFPRHGASAAAVFQAGEVALQEAQDAGGDRVMVFRRAESTHNVEIQRIESEPQTG